MKNERLPKSGTGRGNQNARKHGFYSPVLSPEEQADFEIATGVEGIDDEIALLRVKIKSLIQNDPDNIRLMMRAVNSLTRMLTTKYNLNRDDKQGLKEAIGNVLKDVALPLGIGLSSVLKK